MDPVVPSFIFHQASGSLFETQSWFESFLPLRLRSRRARSSAVGVSMPLILGRAPASPGKPPVPPPHDVAQRRSAPWSRHDPMRSPLTRPPRRSAPEPSRRSPCGPHGAVAHGSVKSKFTTRENHSGFQLFKRGRSQDNPIHPTHKVPRSDGRCPRLWPSPGQIRRCAARFSRRFMRAPKPGRVMATGGLGTSLSHAAGLIEIAACHA